MNKLESINYNSQISETKYNDTTANYKNKRNSIPGQRDHQNTVNLTLFLEDFHQELIRGYIDVIPLVITMKRGFSTDLDAHEGLLIFGHIPIGGPQFQSLNTVGRRSVVDEDSPPGFGLVHCRRSKLGLGEKKGVSLSKSQLLNQKLSPLLLRWNGTRISIFPFHFFSFFFHSKLFSKFFFF